jgi:DNA-binding NtrC family response regulator
MAAPTVAEPSSGPSGQSPALYLVVMGQHGSATHQLPARGTVLIGRAEDAPVRLVDPLASRHHARLHVGGDGQVEIEDLGSANGTRVREVRLERDRPVVVTTGEAIAIGATVLLLQTRAPFHGARQVWPHGYFEARLIEECGRAESLRGTFAILRLRLPSEDAASQSGKAIAKALRPGDILATYGPREYEVLLPDSDRPQSEAVRDQVLAALTRPGLAVRSSLACYPVDGTSPQALVTRASTLLAGDAAEGAPGAQGFFLVQNARMRELCALGERAAATSISVLIAGETGVGKELLAETIHRLSPRAGKPFVCLNCAALSESILESELFGHEKGAFTGAVQAKLGLIEAASGGTLFLDEVGEMPLPMQAKLLRVLEMRQVTRVGATRPVPVDVRFVAATNRDLDEEVASKAFREDLYFRLNGFALEIPPLRERVDEIEPLARHFLDQACRQQGRQAALSDDALAWLQRYPWPGNIRELRNVVERALLLCTGDVITREHLPAHKAAAPGESPLSLPGQAAAQADTGRAIELPDIGAAGEDLDDADDQLTEASVVGGASLRIQKEEVERQAIIDALARCAGSQTRAAELLGMSRRTFCSRLKDYNIPRPRS